MSLGGQKSPIADSCALLNYNKNKFEIDGDLESFDNVKTL